jgi:hypothetical protein
VLASLFRRTAPWSIERGLGCVGGSGRARRQDAHDYAVRTEMDRVRRRGDGWDLAEQLKFPSVRSQVGDDARRAYSGHLLKIEDAFPGGLG